MNEVDFETEALWSLILVSALCGWGAIALFRRFSDQRAIRKTINRLWAHLLEFSLFFDDPIVMLRVQRDVLVTNWHLLKLVTLPSLVLTLMFLVFLPQLDALYGRAPLPLNQPAIVTVRLKNGSLVQLSQVALSSPDGLNIETPGVRAESVKEISWRVKPTRASKATLRIVESGQEIQKTATAGTGVHYLSQWRESSVFRFLLHPTEQLFSDPSIDWIEVRYPPATVLHLPWLVWFVLVSSITAALLSLLRAVRMRFGRH